MKRFLLLLLIFAATAFPTRAEAAACSGTTGVTVVVQFPDNHTEIGCDPGNPSTGFDALTGAGFQLAYVTGAGFLCRINAQPSSDLCHRIPPANAYWGYFHGSRGGSWTYSNEGGGSYDPSPGSVEGWRFQSTTAAQPPSTKPPGLIRPSATATPTRKPKPPAQVAPSAKPVETSPTPTPSVVPTATATGLAAPPTASGSPSPSSSVPDRAAGMGEKTVPASSPSQGVSWIWGIALIAVLGAAAGATFLRRRRS